MRTHRSGDGDLDERLMPQTDLPVRGWLAAKVTIRKPKVKGCWSGDWRQEVPE